MKLKITKYLRRAEEIFTCHLQRTLGGGTSPGTVRRPRPRGLRALGERTEAPTPRVGGLSPPVLGCGAGQVGECARDRAVPPRFCWLPTSPTPS